MVETKWPPKMALAFKNQTNSSGFRMVGTKWPPKLAYAFCNRTILQPDTNQIRENQTVQFLDADCIPHEKFPKTNIKK